MSKEYPRNVLKQLQQTELEIVQAIDAVCAQQHISWFVSCGSLLGAVRHGGFIPWDDDMDIGMLRNDYERFLEVAPDALPDTMRVCMPGAEPGMAAPFAKVCKRNTRFYTQEVIDAGFDQGIFVDIFCYDRISRNASLRARQVKWAKFYKYLLYLYYSGNVYIEGKSGAPLRFYQAASKVAHLFVHAFSSDAKLRMKYEQWAQAAKDEPDTGYASFHRSTGIQIEQEIFLPTYRGRMDGVEVSMPANAEQYLVYLYGENWREVPPPEKRINHAPLVLDFGDGVNVLE